MDTHDRVDVHFQVDVSPGRQFTFKVLQNQPEDFRDRLLFFERDVSEKGDVVIYLYLDNEFDGTPAERGRLRQAAIAYAKRLPSMQPDEPAVANEGNPFAL